MDYLSESDTGHNELFHVGTPRHSGRYPWGSGENPYQHEGWNISVRNAELRKEGYTEKERAEIIGKELGKERFSTDNLRAEISMSKSAQNAYNAARAWDLKQHGYSVSEIGRKMGRNESTIRGWLDPKYSARASKNEQIAEVLKRQVEEKKYLDITSGSEYQFSDLTDANGNKIPAGIGADSILNVTQTSLKTAVAMLEKQGYKKHYIKVEQSGNPGKFTTVKVLTKDDVPYSEVKENRDLIRAPGGVYFDTGNTVRNIKDPVSINSNRISIRYSEDGGSQKDGVIELRKGVNDISLGANQYAQVRIAVDGTHYLKGMAMYSDNMPDGVDIVFNTNKHKGTPKMEVLKPLKNDPSNPFGATVRQQFYDKDGHFYSHQQKDIDTKQSAINIVNDDSDWGHWSRNLSSQMLSKQAPELAKRQLGITYSQKKQEYDEIMSIPNNTFKKVLLEQFASSCDSSAVHLKAAAMPRQETKVILPLTNIKDDQIYAPTFKHGEQVALIRYPHGGTFEIPILTVNKNNPEGRSILKQAPNAIGINANVAKKLSGADFDGDTVIVIPLNGQKIKSNNDPNFKSLQDFDPSEAYPNTYREKVVDGVNFNKQMEMGKVSNLITDMTLAGASNNEIIRAVKHSMVVIDAEKHNLDWQLSEERNGIKALKAAYQGGKNNGASTLISRASGEKIVPERKDFRISDINPDGSISYRDTGGTHIRRWANVDGKQKSIKIDKNGSYFYWGGEKKNEKIFISKDKVKEKVVQNMQSSTNMAEAKDARELLSGPDHNGTVMERVYAEHANKLKALANSARKEYISTPASPYNPQAAKTYSKEVQSLTDKLHISLMNAPRERQAQLIADKVISDAISKDPGLRDRTRTEELTKLRNQALAEARARSGSISRQSGKIDPISGEERPSRSIFISDREWEAIQAGAVSSTKLAKILQNSDLDELRGRVIPREKASISKSKLTRAKAMLAMGYTQAEVAEACGISVATIKNEGLV